MIKGHSKREVVFGKCSGTYGDNGEVAGARLNGSKCTVMVTGNLAEVDQLGLLLVGSEKKVLDILFVQGIPGNAAGEKM